uniref:EF-hand domain-containing protein n=1 Tax=Onchocerca volvulus TaxID=6282 RepID=A0A8R1XMW6_ONCVO
MIMYSLPLFKVLLCVPTFFKLISGCDSKFVKRTKPIELLHHLFEEMDANMDKTLVLPKLQAKSGGIEVAYLLDSDEIDTGWLKPKLKPKKAIRL